MPLATENELVFLDKAETATRILRAALISIEDQPLADKWFKPSGPLLRLDEKAHGCLDNAPTQLYCHARAILDDERRDRLRDKVSVAAEVILDWQADPYRRLGDAYRCEQTIQAAITEILEGINDVLAAAKIRDQAPVEEWQIGWDEKKLDFVPSSEARVEYTNSKMPASTLSTKLGTIPVHFMRKKGKGARVHRREFEQWARRKYPSAFVSEETRSEIADEVAADREAMMQSMRRK